ncbi:GBF-interacting protein 1 isoform X2 [Apium graveolens]|uniref:GBF-interacting protein 1 isoform X2 n=1 Tax=Apium graveolens TaxID=4045 RepID=UPI003D7BE842
MSYGGGRVSIPSNMKKTIQNIKEITGSHDDDEIYTMLKECNMDPNETTHKLLFQDTFHEVKRKRERKKENANKESSDSRWKPSMQGRGSRGGRGNYSSRYSSHDAGGTRSSAPVKENGPSRVPEGSVGMSTTPTSKGLKHKITSVVSSGAVTIDGSSGISSVSVGATGGGNNLTITAADIEKVEGQLALNLLAETDKTTTNVFVPAVAPALIVQTSSNIPSSEISPSSPVAYFSASDPVLVSSQDSRLLGAVGTIKREITPEKSSLVPVESKSIAAFSDVESCLEGKTVVKSQVIHKNHLSDSVQAGVPSSNYVSRTAQVIGPQKGLPIKEWKPKPTNINLALVSGTVASADVPVESTKPRIAAGVLDSKETYSNLEKQLEQSHISESQHVIIPNHIHVPEADKLGFCFGSFDANFGRVTHSSNASAKEKNTLLETSEKIEEISKEQLSQNAMETVEEEDDSKHSASSNVPNSLTTDSDASSTVVVPESSESKQLTDLPSGGNQYSMVNNSPTYSFGILPTMVGSQVTPIQSTESQARDASRLPGFVVQQPFDPNSYYAQFYQTGTGSDTHVSPFQSPGFTTKYTGNVAMLSPHGSQSSQEIGNSLILSTAGPTPLVTQAAGVMQSSIAVTQQPLPVFRQPAGVHLPHYPTNYIPYGHYYSPFYVPPPAIHQFLSNGAFPPQPQPGSFYPAPPVATTKYPLSQYKSGNNTGNSTQMGVPGSYVPYGSSPSGLNTTSSTTGNSASNEGGASHFKENNVYITGQQSEGSGVWFAPGREISGLPASSFYNLPQAQMGYTAAQAGRGSFTSIYHPAQPVTAASVHSLLQPPQTMAGAVDMAGPTASVYQPSQPATLNWPNNY